MVPHALWSVAPHSIGPGRLIHFQAKPNIVFYAWAALAQQNIGRGVHGKISTVLLLPHKRRKFIFVQNVGR